MRQREDKQLAMSAMLALLDRGYGRPPQAVYAQIGGTETPQIIEFRWADAKTNLLPGEIAPGVAAPVIEAAAGGNGNGADEEVPIIVWGDGSDGPPADGANAVFRAFPMLYLAHRTKLAGRRPDSNAKEQRCLPNPANRHIAWPWQDPHVRPKIS
jgi:hypothetical protein